MEDGGGQKGENSDGQSNGQSEDGEKSDGQKAGKKNKRDGQSKDVGSGTGQKVGKKNKRDGQSEGGEHDEQSEGGERDGQSKDGEHDGQSEDGGKKNKCDRQKEEPVKVNQNEDQKENREVQNHPELIKTDDAHKENRPVKCKRGGKKKNSEQEASMDDSDEPVVLKSLNTTTASLRCSARVQKQKDEQRSKLKSLQDKRSKSLAAKFILGKSSVTYRPPPGILWKFRSKGIKRQRKCCC